MATSDNTKQVISSDEKPPSIFVHLIKYFKIRGRQFTVFSYVLVLYIREVLMDLKTWSVRRMFWGRSSFYRTSFHLIISIITITALLSGVSTRLNILSANEPQGLDLTSGVIGRQDIISQSGTAESISSISEDEVDYRIFRHKVQTGETLSQIAELYSINQNSIRWANQMTNDSIKPDQILRIPEIDGAFIKVLPGDTLETIATRNNGNVADIIDLNSNIIDYRDPVLKEGMEIFIPGGEIPLPTPTRRTGIYAIAPRQQYVPPAPATVNVPGGSFIHPLANCPGWSWSRGYASWHRGVDMAKRGGCWVNSAASGVVIRTGWTSGGQGFNVVVDHGNGLHTRYYHGNGNFAVSVGQAVSAGQSLMYMGNTGYSFGTHLHFEVVVNGVRLNPENYVRLR